MATINISEVNVVGLYGGDFLHHEGIGAATLDSNGTITKIVCGIFGQQNPIPVVGSEYRITGVKAGTIEAFEAHLICMIASRPQCTFERQL